MEFVKWWDESVGVRHGAGRGNKKNAEHGSFSAAQATEQTGITQQQVSKWRKRLQEPEKYRDMLYGPAYHKAMAEVGDFSYQLTAVSYNPALLLYLVSGSSGRHLCDVRTNRLEIKYGVQKCRAF